MICISYTCVYVQKGKGKGRGGGRGSLEHLKLQLETQTRVAVSFEHERDKAYDDYELAQVMTKIKLTNINIPYTTLQSLLASFVVCRVMYVQYMYWTCKTVHVPHLAMSE